MSHSHLLYHIVFGTKDRFPLISESWEAELYGYLGGIVKNQKGRAIEINGMPDHVHLLVRLEPCDFPAFMRELKASSSKWAKRTSRNFRGSGVTERLPLANRRPMRCGITFANRRHITENKRSKKST